MQENGLESWLEFLEFLNNRCVIVSDISLSWQWVTRQPRTSFQDQRPVIRQELVKRKTPRRLLIFSF